MLALGNSQDELEFRHKLLQCRLILSLIATTFFEPSRFQFIKMEMYHGNDTSRVAIVPSSGVGIEAMVASARSNSSLLSIP